VSTQQDQMARVERLLAPSIEDMGYALVRVRMMGGKSRPTLQVMAERLDRAEMRVDDCASLSRAISALLDVEDPIPGAYVLEVSSPGIDRPLVRLADFERFAGFEARLETTRPIDGRRRYKGRLMGLAGDRIRIALDGDAERVTEVPFAELMEAKLVLTDELIRDSLRQRGR
jgi:ribosome maturation factor RimP